VVFPEGTILMARGSQDTKGPRDKGSSRLYCTDAPFPDDDAQTTTGIVFRPNVLLYAGDGDWSGLPLCREGSIGSSGTNDFAIEMWIKRNYPDSIATWRTAAADATGYGITGEDHIAGGAPGAGVWFRGANFEAYYDDDGASLVTVTGTLPFGWNHVAVNFVRGGSFTLFINGVSQGTGACGSTSFSADSGISILGCTGQTAATAASGKLHPPYRLAAFAAHNTTLPTQADYRAATEEVSLAETAGTNTRLFISDTEMLTNSTHPASSPANADEGDWFWLAIDTSVDTQLEEYSSAIPMFECSETYAASDTSEGGTIYSGAQTFARTGNNMDVWYQRVFSEGSTFRAGLVVFGDDPSWPPPRGITGKGYA
jgi:hypothetical protein